MRQKLTELLSSANLKSEEIKIYLLLLKFGSSTMQKLMKESKLNSMMVYRTLKMLLEKELINEKKLNNKQFIYCALSLKSLIEKIERQHKKLLKLTKSLENLDPILPYLELNIEKESESIELREGLDAFREEYLKLPLICENEYLHIGSIHNLWETAGLEYDSPEERYFINTRINHGVYCRILNKLEKEQNEFLRRDSIEKRSSKFTNNIPITENYLAITENQSSLFICDSENPQVLIIKEPGLRKLHKDQFQHLWDTA